MGHQEGEAPPEALLIRLARQAKGLSPEAAAALLPIKLSGNRWRQIEKGYERRVPLKSVRAPDATLAHMAHVVGVSPERLDDVDRPDAANILREILRSDGETPANSEALTTREQEMLAEMVASAAEGFDLTPEQLDAAMARARQLVMERRASRAGGGGDAQRGRAS
ncbi:hypothetical protein ACIQPR_18385 [Streptomyces sp. NPDC091280]|uniref:hypothetical protein n=1 Tax=Streptomyces sp. NPDC091280 TaxID=3365984 RepID=UPI00381E263D